MPSPILAEIKCPQCHSSFAPRRHWQLFCSVPCRTQHYWENHTVVPNTALRKLLKRPAATPVELRSMFQENGSDSSNAVLKNRGM